MKRSSTDSTTVRKIITLKNFQVIDGYVKDMAYVQESNDSAVIENILLEHILPEETVSANYVKKVYTIGLKEAVLDLLNYLDGKKELIDEGNRTSLLVNLLLQIFDNRYGVGYDEAYSYLLKEKFPANCKMVADKMKYEMQARTLSFNERQMLEDDLALLELTQRNSVDFIPYNYMSLVVNNWEILNDNKFVYRMISNVVALSMEDYWNRADLRLKAISVIAEMCKNWKNE